MSEENNPPSQQQPAKPPAAARQRRWRRRLIFAAVALVAIVVVFRLILIVALPPVLRHVAAHYGLNAAYEKMDLYLFDGDVGVWHFTLKPVQGGDSLIQSEYTRCHVSTLDLLRGRLTIRRLEAEGVTMLIERNADGTIPLLQRFLPTAAPSSAAPAASPALPVSSPAAVQNIDLTSPLEIDAFRLTNVHAHIRDAAVNPPVDADVDVSVRLTDLNSSERPTQLQLDMSAPPILDLLHVEGSGTAVGQSLDAWLHVQVRGLHPLPAAGYLEPLGIRPTARWISMQMNAQLKTTPTTQPDAVAATLTLDHLSATADGEEAAAMDKLTLNADALGFNTARLSQLNIEGVRCKAHRSPEGNFGLGGIELAAMPSPAPASATVSPPLPVAVAEAAATVTAGDSPAVAAAATRVPFAPLHWGLGQMVISDCKMTMEDQAVSPATDLSFQLNDLTVGAISPDSPDVPAPIMGHFTMPGIASAIRLDGHVLPLAATKSVDLNLAVNGIRPDALRPYLDALGLESAYSDGTFTASLHADGAQDADGSLSANAKLSNIMLKDKQELLALTKMDVSGAGYDPASRRIHVKSIEISGPRVAGQRETSGAFSILGLRTKPKTAAPAPAHVAAVESAPATAAVAATTSIAAAPATSEASATDFAALIPKLQIDRFTWKDVQLRFDDLAVSPPASLASSDAGVELTDLNFDLDPADPPTKPGKLHAWIAVPKVVENISVDGSIGTGAGQTTLDFSVNGKGITAGHIAEYFRAARVQPVLRDGSFHLNAHAELSGTNGGLGAAMGIKNAVYKDGPDELLAVDSAEIAGISLQTNRLSIDRVDVKSPRLTASRDADGSVLVAGIRIQPAPPAPAVSPNSQFQTTRRPQPVGSAVAVATTTTSTAPSPAAPSGFAAMLGELDVHDASVRWADRAVQPAASAHLVADIDLQQAVVGASAPPAKLKITAREDQALDNLTITGAITPSLNNPKARLDIDATGIRGGSLSSYAGPDAQISLQNGQFHAAIEAAIDKNPAGGRGVRLLVSGLDYRERNSAAALCQLDSLRISASRVDLPAGFNQGGVIAIDEISMNGLQAAANRSADGKKFSMMGLSFGHSPDAATPLPSASTRAATAPSAVAAPIAVKALALSDLAGIGRKKYPLVTLNNLNLNVQRISFTDESRPDAAPLALSNFYLWNINQIELLGDNPAPRQKIEMELAGSIDPLVKSVNVHALLWPFAEQPGLTVNVNLAGIRGEGLTELVPELKGKIDGSSLTDGQFGAHLGLRMKRDHKDPLNFDLSRGIGLDVMLKAVQYQDASGGPVVAGIEDVSSENIRVQNGGSRVIFKEIDLTNPSMRILRDAAGVHILGWIVKIPFPSQPRRPLAKAPTTSVSPKVASRPMPPAPTLQPTLAARPKPKTEIRIDKILVSGLDFNFEDRTSKPRLVIPLNSLDVEVRDLSTLMLYQDLPCRFEVMLGAGKVPPKQNELFSQVEASGVVSLYPYPKGWIKTSLSGLDLAALRGGAKEAGVDLGGGTFDSAIDVRLGGDGTIDTHSRLVLTDLLIAEPSNGPIRRSLKLNVPLDVVIAALQDPDGSITIPLDMPIHSGRISRSDVSAAAIGAMARVMTTAVASAPLKAADSVLSILGNDKTKKTNPPVVLNFDPADPSLGLAEVLKLQAILQQMRDDPTLVLTLRHELGGGDVARASMLANPSPEDCRNLADRLRMKKIELLAARDAASQSARAQLASGYGSDADESVRHLRDIDRAIANAEDALDHVYDMLRPGADRQAARRTRAASLQIAQDRLDVVRQALLSSQLPGIDQRVKLAHPTYTPATGDAGGKISIVLTQRKD